MNMNILDLIVDAIFTIGCLAAMIFMVQLAVQSGVRWGGGASIPRYTFVVLPFIVIMLAALALVTQFAYGDAIMWPGKVAILVVLALAACVCWKVVDEIITNSYKQAPSNDSTQP